MHYHFEALKSFSLFKEISKNVQIDISNEGITWKIRQSFEIAYLRKFNSSFSNDCVKEFKAFVKLNILFSAISEQLLSQFRKGFSQVNKLLLKVET